MAYGTTHNVTVVGRVINVDIMGESDLRVFLGRTHLNRDLALTQWAFGDFPPPSSLLDIRANLEYKTSLIEVCH